MALMLFFNRVFYEGARWISKNAIHHNLTTPADSLFPFLPWTIVIYFGCFLWWGIVYWLMAGLDREEGDRFFSALILAEAICFIIYIVFPTTNIRPEVSGSSVWDQLMRFLYRIDAPDNLFPSIHCMISWLCWISLKNNREVSIYFRYGSLFMAIAVCLSTLTTRQHVLPDVAAGILLAELCRMIMKHPMAYRWYTRLTDEIMRRF